MCKIHYQYIMIMIGYVTDYNDFVLIWEYEQEQSQELEQELRAGAG